VQTVIPLSDGSALRLTTSKYFTPLGKVIHEKGVEPDIIIEEEKPAAATGESEKDKAAKPEDVFEQVEKKEKKEEPRKDFDYKSDSQLMRAVDILKGIKIYKATSSQ
jgi:carboxyl-terminal processing protease